MANFDPADVTGYPFGTGDPLPHAAVNKLAENQAKTPNAAEGSSHAPTDVIAWSGSGGGGFTFSDAFKFSGELDVTSNLVCTAPSAGSVTFDALVAVDIRGPMTFKSVAHSGAPASAQFESGCLCTFASSATLTCASGSTTNLTGDVNVRGTMTVKSTAGGGPGHVVFQTDSDLTLNSGATQYVYGTVNMISGAVMSNGPYLHSARVRRVRATLTDADQTITVNTAHLVRLNNTCAGSRTVTLSAVTGSPQDGEMMWIYRTTVDGGSISDGGLHDVILKSSTGANLFIWSPTSDKQRAGVLVVFDSDDGDWIPIMWQNLGGTGTGLFGD